jgi:succinyl-CoA synthetase alpha subunit
MSKPVIAYVAGQYAPKGKRMGHAGAIVQGGRGDAKSKIDAFKRAGVAVAENPMDIPQLVKDFLYYRAADFQTALIKA